MRTTPLAKASEVERKWYVIDGEDVVLGRLSSVVASILRGKNKPTYTPNVDTGDNVIVINADKVRLTGRKAKNKIYYSHSDHPGGLKSISAGQKQAEKPDRFIEDSVRGMLPKNTLGRLEIKKLHVYAGSEHNHQAQNPEKLDINKLI
ncbi:50S ribosomal protein L13 [Companilactobacillus paralimentarius DSM 13238 = JCM 10415]|uniref:Large ribosomal subunit protein uL13 n=5 Tax=Companilactobacillus TaxID=2767879 RepID=A0ABR5NTR8_9LACO|nr:MULTISPECIES: 50S ribosomal protein L13 [Companilactobacillus]KAE9557067.1 50S ribosomal protein L13 [Companilactobacillus bobalius]KAE9558665.1 50S ribosomal protein L13 [Companilactobacillus kimchii]KAE9561135.1 50S ribosomal protein L13 [Companilactobacillus paralimentarius]KRK51794.1 50S ribosomal protein L13 [Companilactobacillus kimchii DSM 13961 = JCM 10707]KRK81993.1 50S ribosomal protein L13 [Companilactobacillus bobalius DSM 19674]